MSPHGSTTRGSVPSGRERGPLRARRIGDGCRTLPGSAQPKCGRNRPLAGRQRCLTCVSERAPRIRGTELEGGLVCSLHAAGCHQPRRRSRRPEILPENWVVSGWNPQRPEIKAIEFSPRSCWSLWGRSTDSTAGGQGASSPFGRPAGALSCPRPKCTDFRPSTTTGTSPRFVRGLCLA